MIHLRIDQWTLIGAVLVFLLSGLSDRLFTFADINVAMNDLLQDIRAYKHSPAYTLSVSFTADKAPTLSDKKYESVVQESRFSSAQFVRAQYASWTGEVDKARAAWQALLHSGERTELASLALGIIALEQGDLESALGLWSRQGNNSIHYFYLINQGDFFLRNGEREVALEYYRLAEYLRPDDLDLALRIVMADIYLQNQESYFARLNHTLDQEGLETTTQAIARLHTLVSDGFVWIFFAIADIYQHREDDIAAEKVLRLATQIHRGPVSYSPLGAFYCNHGRYSEGIAVLEQAKPYGSQYYALQARQRLTICLCRSGERDKALAEAQELSEMAPVDTPFHSWDLQLIQNWSQLCEPAQ